MFIDNINARLKIKVSPYYPQWMLTLSMRTYKVICHECPTYRRKKNAYSILM